MENREYISKHQVVISSLGRGCSLTGNFRIVALPKLAFIQTMQTRADDFLVPVLWPSDATIIGRFGDR